MLAKHWHAWRNSYKPWKGDRTYLGMKRFKDETHGVRLIKDFFDWATRFYAVRLVVIILIPATIATTITMGIYYLVNYVV